MASGGGIQLTLKGDWQKFRMWVAAFEGNLSKASRAAVKKSVQFALAEIDKGIRGGNYAALSSLTAQIRGMENYGNTPLLRTGGLIRAVTTEIVDDFTGIVGVKKNASTSRRGRDASGRFSSEAMANIAELLHEGTTIKITPAMRRAFARKFGGRLSVSGGAGKSTIRIPPRPFIGAVFDNPAFVKRVERFFADELYRVLGF